MKAITSLVLATMLLAGLGGQALGVEGKQDSKPDRADDLFSELQRRAFDFFWYEAHPRSGLVKDRAGNRAGDEHRVASIASTGFGLGAICVGVEHGWVTREEGRDRALRTMRFVRDRLNHQRGWLYHFVDWETGRRVWNCEVSSIDTALFLAGALLAGQYFGEETETLARELYRRVDFQWMLVDGGKKPDSKLLCHGWTPESGFLKSRWDTYSEHLILNLLAIGAGSNGIPAECWYAWDRRPGEFRGHQTFICGPLFTYQYSQAFIPFKGRRDRHGYDYHEAAVGATLANRQYCIEQSGTYRSYSSNFWGLSACDKPVAGYQAYGAPPGPAVHDGTVAPWSTVAAVAFTPLAEEAVLAMYDQMHRLLWGRYGFGNSFNVDQNWYAPEVIGIDLGCALMLIENHRTGFVWRQFSQMDWLKEAMKRVGCADISGSER